mmetsp:Transcript_30416/g.71211  ORF Transcript_30416/g.71211 Transcript_30416/m.71211 type:complete len:225 (+) Transcript_30416:66-740(+)
MSQMYFAGGMSTASWSMHNVSSPLLLAAFVGWARSYFRSSAAFSQSSPSESLSSPHLLFVLVFVANDEVLVEEETTCTFFGPAAAAARDDFFAAVARDDGLHVTAEAATDEASTLLIQLAEAREEGLSGFTPDGSGKDFFTPENCSKTCRPNTNSSSALPGFVILLIAPLSVIEMGAAFIVALPSSVGRPISEQNRTADSAEGKQRSRAKSSPGTFSSLPKLLL